MVSNASGYELYMSKKSNSGFRRIITTKKTNYTKQKLAKKQTYYFKVRAYCDKKEQRIYGVYSKTVKMDTHSTQKIKNMILRLRKKFPNGKYWNHAGKKVKKRTDISNFVTNKPCHHNTLSIASTCNRYYCKASNTVGYQCWGYADKISDLVFGVNSKIRKHLSFAKVKVGDHIRYNGHSVVVVSKGNSYVKVTEANYGNTCQIRWGRKLTKRQLKGALYYTRY